MLTEYRRNEIFGILAIAKDRAKNVVNSFKAARQSVLDSRSRYNQAQEICLANGMSESDFESEIGVGYGEDIAAINAEASVELIALLADVGRRTGQPPKAVLSAIAAGAPDSVPTDDQIVEIIGGAVQYVDKAQSS
ncbi:MAG: hypothetical protein AAF745_14335 [Planctomycetota bacterium]